MCAAGELCPRYGQASAESDYVITPGSGYLAPVGTEFKQQRPCPEGYYDNTSGGSVGDDWQTHCS